MYSPFRNEQGQPKDLADVTYEDLSQLADLDEGFVLEFKRTWNDNVRKRFLKLLLRLRIPVADGLLLV